MQNNTSPGLRDEGGGGGEGGRENSNSKTLFYKDWREREGQPLITLHRRSLFLHTHTHTKQQHTHSRVQVHTHTHTHARARARAQGLFAIDTSIKSYKYTHTRTHRCARAHIRTHTGVRAHGHTHTYTQTQTHKGKRVVGVGGIHSAAARDAGRSDRFETLKTIPAITEPRTARPPPPPGPVLLYCATGPGPSAMRRTRKMFVQMQSEL